MECIMCSKPMEKRVVCPGCRHKLVRLKDALESGRKDIHMSRTLAPLVDQLQDNQINGGYVPHFFVQEPVMTVCEQCDNEFPRLGTTRSCVKCRKESKAWSGLVARGDSINSSNAMWLRAVRYYCRYVNGKVVPDSFLRWLERIDKNAEDKLYTAAQNEATRAETNRKLREEAKRKQEEEEARVAAAKREMEAKVLAQAERLQRFGTRKANIRPKIN